MKTLSKILFGFLLLAGVVENVGAVKCKLFWHERANEKPLNLKLEFEFEGNKDHDSFMKVAACKAFDLIMASKEITTLDNNALHKPEWASDCVCKDLMLPGSLEIVYTSYNEEDRCEELALRLRFYQEMTPVARQLSFFIESDLVKSFKATLPESFMNRVAAFIINNGIQYKENENPVKSVRQGIKSKRKLTF